MHYLSGHAVHTPVHTSAICRACWAYLFDTRFHLTREGPPRLRDLSRRWGYTEPATPGRGRRTNTVFVSIMTRSAEHTRYVFEPTVTRSKFLKCTPRSALLTALITIVAAMAVTSSASPASSATVSMTVTIRWPSTVGGETAHVFPLRIPIGETISAVRAYFPDGAIAESGGKAYIVDCAHRGPSLAVLSTVSLDGLAWFTIILETGRCTNGPTDRGKRVTIKIEAHER